MEGIKSIELRNNVLYFITSKNSMGKRAVLECDVFLVIGHSHDALLYVRKNKAYGTLMKVFMYILRIKQ